MAPASFDGGPVIVGMHGAEARRTGDAHACRCADPLARSRDMRRPEHLDLDLVLISAASLLALVMAAAQLPAPLRLPLGLAAVLLLPGYAVSMALFPPGDVDGVERAALAFSLSLGVIVLMAPLLDLTSGGLTVTSITAAVSLITVVAAAIAAWRRRSRPEVGQLPAVAILDRRVWRRIGRWQAAAAIASAALLLIGIVGLGVFTPRPAATEFYMLGPGGIANSLPGHVVSGAPVTITLGISNDDGSGQPYRIVVESAAARLASIGPINVGSGARWTGHVDFVVPAPGTDQEIRILLFKGAGAQAYRSLRLEIDAVPPA